jgi:hypothetical protein
MFIMYYDDFIFKCDLTQIIHSKQKNQSLPKISGRLMNVP